MLNEKETILTVRNISKKYIMGEVEVIGLKKVSFDIYEGEFIVVLGPSGSGKSTLLNIIGGMDTPTSGEILYRGKPIQNMKEKELTKFRKDAIGFVFQFYNLIPTLTAKENISLATEISDKSFDLQEVLDQVELSDRANHFPSQLSGGQQQRVAIARAIAKNPDILLCDEPTGALDHVTGISVLKSIKNVNKKYNKTVIIITHNADIAQIADRVFYIKDGLLDKIEVVDNPIDPEGVSW